MRELWRSRSGRLLKLLLISIGAVTAICVAGIVLLSDDASRIDATHGQKLIEHDNGQTDGSPLKYTIPQARIPKSVADAKQAASIALTPSRWEHDPNETGADAIAVPAQTRDAIVQAANEFLNRWETFQPSRLGDQSYLSWRENLSQLVSPANLAAIADRQDSHQPASVCPQPGCQVGSELAPDIVNPVETIIIRNMADNEVYLTASGAVKYTGIAARADPLFSRSYGLVLANRDGDGEWRVERAAADTAGPVR
jgi:hypothetical protein